MRASISNSGRSSIRLRRRRWGANEFLAVADLPEERSAVEALDGGVDADLGRGDWCVLTGWLDRRHLGAPLESSLEADLDSPSRGRTRDRLAGP